MYIFLAIYTVILIIIWGFFIVAKIHAYKFKNFSGNIESVTKMLLIWLGILSILWYWLIIYMYTWGRSPDFDFDKSDYYFNSVNY